MPDLMFRISREGTYRGYNAPDPGDLISKVVVGARVHDRLPAELADRVLGAGRAAVDRGTPQMIEYELAFSGQVRHYEARFAASADKRIRFTPPRLKRASCASRRRAAMWRPRNAGSTQTSEI